MTGYQILRRRPEECEFGYSVYVENTNSTSTSWRDTNAEIGTLYEYHVRAINDVGAGTLDRRNSTSVRRLRAVVWIIIAHSTEVIGAGFSFEMTIAVGHLKLDDDPDTVDYALRGDVTLDADGSDADACEGDGLGEDIQLTVIDEVAEHFTARWGGTGCNEGDYTLIFVITDRDGREIGPFEFEFEVLSTCDVYRQWQSIGIISSFRLPATGEVAITGSARVGETLTAPRRLLALPGTVAP